MSQQINLYDASLLRKREPLTARNLALASGMLVVLLAAWGGWIRTRLTSLEGESQAVAPQAKALQDQRDMMTAQLAALKPDPQIEAELASARALLDLHGKQIGELKKGVSPEAGGFAEYLRGFARQTPAGLWLTGFAIKDSGAAMEIRGRMTDPALLPEYIRRLDAEQAFKGREFAALKVVAGKADAEQGNPSPPAAPAQAPTAAPVAAPAAGPAPFYEFTLTQLLRKPQAAPGAGQANPSGGQR